MERIFNTGAAGPLAGVRESEDPLDMYEYNIRALIFDAVSYEEADLAPEREKAQRYYYGQEPTLASAPAEDIYGDPPLDTDNEDAGRSTVVSTDVRDTVMTIMPTLMRIFAGTEHAVEFTANYEEQVELAAQATDYVRLKLWNHNDGFMILHGAFKDALTVKIGIVTWWTDHVPKISEKTFNNVSQEQLAGLMAEEALQPELVSYDPPVQGPEGPVTNNVVIRYKKSAPQLRVAGVPPEEFRINRSAKSIEDAQLVGHECYVRISDLVEQGYDHDFLVGKAGSFYGWSEEKDLRNPGFGTDFSMHDYVKYGAFYVRADSDGDGINELRFVVTVGEDYEIIRDEMVDEARFAVFTPDPTPHTLVGDSAADLVMDIQRINTNLLRAGLDSLTASIFPRTGINELTVNVDDALNDDIGALVRVKGDPAAGIYTYNQPFVGQAAFDAKAQMDVVRQGRTGISEASKGLDPRALQSTNVVGVEAVLSGAQERIELIALIFAHGGMKRLYRGLLKEITENPNEGETVKLRGKYTRVNPSLYDPDMLVEVNPALGKGSDQARLAALMQIQAQQTMIVEKFGIGNGVVGPQELRNTVVDMAQLSNIRNVTRYFREIPPEMAQAMEAAPQEPSPELLLAQSALEEVRSKTAIATAKVKQKDDEIDAKDDLERDKLSVNAFLKLTEIAQTGILATAEADAAMAEVDERNQDGA